MSLITSCPSCGTMFRVVPDQLKISEGWVRCGHCSEVFDASAHLSDESVLDNLEEAQGTMSAPLDEETTAPEPRPAPPVPPPPAPRRPMPERTATAPADAKGRTPSPASDRSDEPSDFFGDEPTDEPLVPSPLDAPFVFRRPELSLKDLDELEPGQESQILPEDLMPPSGLEPDEPVPDVSFVRQGRRRAFWRRPFVRLVLALLVLLLGALLAGQAAYQDRDRLALARPELRPALERMCDLLGCRIGPPRQIEAIVIDSSGFNRLRNDTYRLTFTLRNSAGVPVAVPAMELTITDAQDQTVARRVLLPAELGAPADATIAAGGDWSRTVGVALSNASASRVAGYRLLAFYP
jgi:predicted Zn finger-like uncharacterized protein